MDWWIDVLRNSMVETWQHHILTPGTRVSNRFPFIQCLNMSWRKQLQIRSRYPNDLSFQVAKGRRFRKAVNGGKFRVLKPNFIFANIWWIQHIVKPNLVGGCIPTPSWKICDFVNWDDEINPIWMGKCQNHGNQLPPTSELLFYSDILVLWKI